MAYRCSEAQAQRWWWWWWWRRRRRQLHPGYAPCLVDHGGADYDCAGGSGNGPYYTAAGVVYRVTGSDPYGLDADNDGFGCE